jgi:radical SAM superfamily enzyme
MKAIRRKNHIALVESVISQLRSRAIDFEVSLIYGLPEQTVSSFRTSVEWCLTRGVPTVRAFPLMLLRGTPMERDRARWRLVENDEPIPLVVESSTFSRSEWATMRRIAEGLTAAAERLRLSRALALG